MSAEYNRHVQAGGPSSYHATTSHTSLRMYCAVFIKPCNVFQPITMAGRSKALTVLTRTNAGTVGSNPAQGIDVCL